jgi:hypothetical protein
MPTRLLPWSNLQHRSTGSFSTGNRLRGTCPPEIPRCIFTWPLYRTNMHVLTSAGNSAIVTMADMKPQWQLRASSPIVFHSGFPIITNGHALVHTSKGGIYLATPRPFLTLTLITHHSSIPLSLSNSCHSSSLASPLTEVTLTGAAGPLFSFLFLPLVGLQAGVRVSPHAVAAQQRVNDFCWPHLNLPATQISHQLAAWDWHAPYILCLSGLR